MITYKLHHILRFANMWIFPGFCLQVQNRKSLHEYSDNHSAKIAAMHAHL
jgi:hypothetical protein